MTGSDGPDKEIWGTWEDLLLACAVNRHGTKRWDSVAMEMQTRSPSCPHLTAETCERRYHDLRRRFAADDRGIDARDVVEGPESKAIPWLEELRKIRVAELRCEVQRYDVSIVSLQLKVKRLKEERERSLQEESGDRKPDPVEADEAKREADSPACSPENIPADRISGGDSGRSCNESNSTHPKDDRDPSGAEDGRKEEVTGDAGNDVKKPDPVTGGDEKAAGEGSYNGSSDTVAKGAEAATTAEEPATTAPAQAPDAGESGESVAESKGEPAAKESSDVQSSASLSSRRRGRRKVASGGSSGAGEAEADEVSPACKGNVAKSQPLVAFLEIVRSHKYGSMFERRLESQESVWYRSLIRQHMDLEMVRNKLDGGAYASAVEIHRDLLLLCTNAVVFFPKKSTEYAVAVQLREFVGNQIATTTQNPSPSPPAAEEPAPPPPPPPPPAPAPPAPPVSKPKSDPDLAGSLLDKPNSTPPLVACRKRSSISAKAAAASVAAPAKVEKEEKEEKPDLDKKEPESAEKKKTKERSSVSGVRGLRTSKTRGSGSGNAGGVGKSSGSNAAPSQADDATETAKTERKNSGGGCTASPAGSVAKKRSAANFLNRMKGSSSSSNGTLLETLKRSGGGGRGGGGGDQKKGGGKGEGRKDQQSSRQGSSAAGRKQAQEQNAPVKRSVGRPPKRPPPPLPAPSAKRSREVGAEVSPPPPRASSASTRRRGKR